jgi:sigma-E factor negative regulatory protein RseA
MSIESEGGSSPFVNLSALVDGELEASGVSNLCTSWREDPAVRARWHAYQLIGDVLRSEDLASSAARDSIFLATLRSRLAMEPTVLAPDSTPNIAEPVHQRDVVHVGGAGRTARWSWMAPSAVAAGFVLVAGALMVTRTPVPADAPGGATMARGTVNGVAPQTVVAATEMTFEPQQLGPTGKLVRNPKLDRYLAAHQQFAGTSALGVPSGFLRNAAAEAPNR